ncbi:hypothetical protein HN789_05995 [archaeon]|jgi:hypothetical protein|nr:hypothetical protein [archaeon]MBT4022321.1 hypothetical protein [archaeon]MBT4273199.1 hypothetical protein [archaeon]MBT4461358.1 hypothetical protein [archaeon]MBT4858898.1 hypothetical protein [archaeon]
MGHRLLQARRFLTEAEENLNLISDEHAKNALKNIMASIALILHSLQDEHKEIIEVEDAIEEMFRKLTNTSIDSYKVLIKK